MTTQHKGTKSVTNSLLVLIAGYALCGGSISVLMNQIIDEFSLVGAGQGLMTSMISVGSMLAILAVPFFQGRLKKTLILSVSALLQCTMMAAIGLSPSFALLLAACLLMGVGGGWVDNYANSSIMDIHKNNSSKYMGLLHGCYGVGAVLTPLFIQGLLFFTGWRNVYLAASVLALGVALQFMAVARRQKAVFASTADAEGRLDAAQIKRYFSDKYTLMIVLCSFFYGLTQAGLLGWMVRYMKVSFNNEALGAVTVSVFWLFATISRFAAPRIKVPPLRLIMGGLGLSILFHSAGVLLGNPWLMVAFTAANGLASGHCAPLIIHEGVVRHPGYTSTATSITMLVNRLSAVGMPLLVGAVAALSMRTAMLLPSLCMAAALLFAWAAHLQDKRLGE